MLEASVTPLYRFSDLEHRSRSWQAVQAWTILVTRATHQQTFTYGQLAEAMGYSGRAANTLSDVLDHIYAFCMVHQLPLLTVLIEGDQTGRPNAADGLYHEPGAERRRVHKYNWFDVIPPTAVGMAECYRIFWPTQS